MLVEIIVGKFNKSKPGTFPDVEIMLVAWCYKKQVAGFVGQHTCIELVKPASFINVNDFKIGMAVSGKVKLRFFKDMKV
jgi:hypothetical protein